MDRAGLKRQAADVIKRNRRPILLASFLFYLLAAVFSYLSARLTLPSTEQLLQLSDQIAAGRYEAAQKFVAGFEPGFKESLMSDVLSYLLAIVGFGFLLLLLNAIRGQEVSAGMMLDGFGSWAKVLLLELLVRLIVTLGFFLFVFPGILALYTYRMSSYMLLRHPDYGVLDCLRESRQRMRGHRFSLFTLDLSFLGWALLSSIPLIGIPFAIYTLPYWNCSCLLYYESLCSQPAPGEQEPNPPQ